MREAIHRDALRARALCVLMVSISGALTLTACGSPGTPVRPTAVASGTTFSDPQPAERCINVAAEGTALFGPVQLPNGTAGFGALAVPVTMGDFTGALMAVVVSEEISGSGQQGALHVILQHAFQISGAGGDYFVTQDRAVCAPAGTDPLTCRINDVLTITGGMGIFSNANGSLRNHATVDFAQGTMEFSTRGRVCADGL